MTDHQFECLHILLVGIANDLSAIRGLLEKQQAPALEVSTNAMSGAEYAASMQSQS